MRENLTLAEIETALRANLIACMDEYGVKDVPVLQHFDYLKKGRRDTAIYFSVLNPIKVGSSHRRYTIDGDDAGHEELQHMQADAQIMVVADDDPLELVLTVSSVLGSLPFIEKMRDSGIGVQAISGFTTLPVKDDHDNYTLESSATLPITFNRLVAPKTGVVEVEVEVLSF